MGSCRLGTCRAALITRGAAALRRGDRDPPADRAPGPGVVVRKPAVPLPIRGAHNAGRPPDPHPLPSASLRPRLEGRSAPATPHASRRPRMPDAPRNTNHMTAAPHRPHLADRTAAAPPGHHATPRPTIPGAPRNTNHMTAALHRTRLADRSRPPRPQPSLPAGRQAPPHPERASTGGGPRQNLRRTRPETHDGPVPRRLPSGPARAWDSVRRQPRSTAPVRSVARATAASRAADASSTVSVRSSARKRSA